MNAITDKWARVMLGILIATVFFEGHGYSFQLLGLRLRSVQVFEVLFLGLLGALTLLGKWRWQKSPLDYWLLAYLSVNFIAIYNSQWKARAVKIFLLLVTLVLLYWLVYQLQRTVKDVFLAFYVFLAMGTLQVLFGLYQVFAGALNHYRGWRLPIGYLGMVHREYINSVWGRPYGTQVEPDFYGAICMVFALIFIILYFSKSGKIKKWLLAGILISLLGLYLSFVRAAWLVFLLVLPLLPFFRRKLSFFRFTWKSAVFIVAVAVGVHVIAANSIPPIKRICKARFAAKEPAQMEKGSVWKQDTSLLNNKNFRLSLIRISLQGWRKNPVLGNGPGGFAYTYWRSGFGDAGARQRIADKAFPQTNHSMLFTVLGDAGLLGLIIFMLIAGKIFLLGLQRFAAPSTVLTPHAFALFVGLVALFLSYILTDGLWLPLTWVFLGIGMAHWRCFSEATGESSAKKTGT